MIRLHAPEISKNSQELTRISCKIEINQKTVELWYDFPIEIENYLMVERLDAFLVGILFLALKEGDDIELNAPVSQQLYYNITHYLIDALCLANPEFKRIKIIAKKLDNHNYNMSNSAGTGMSCGIDSFATFFDHLDEAPPFKIEFLTFFNVGSHGDFGGDQAHNIFEERFKRAKKFAEKVGIPLVKINSNLSEVLRMNFLQTNTLRNISAILLLQKLFRNYYLASKNRFDIFELNAFDNQDYDTLTLNLLSTESTNLYSAVSYMKRTEKTEFITNYKETFDSLDVCVHPNHADPRINCSECFKCLRTMLTLDVFDKLELYSGVFNLAKYRAHKNSFIGEIIVNRKNSHFNQDIFDLLKEKKQLSGKHYLFALDYKFKVLKKKGKKRFKKLFA